MGGYITRTYGKPAEGVVKLAAMHRGGRIVIEYYEHAFTATVRLAWNSFGVQTKLRQADQLTDEYDITQMPEMGIQGRFTATAVPSDGPASVLRTTDYLVDRIRKGG